MRLFEKLNQKIELLRLEQRYTKGRNRRSTFVSEALYVDGEYIYEPTSSFSKATSQRLHVVVDEVPEAPMSPASGRNYRAENSSGRSEIGSGSGSEEEKKVRRTSRMGALDWRRGVREEREKEKEKRRSVLGIRELQWNDNVRS
ncbi:hypothetical protein BJ878DRAFT_176905 [Calycina marina]|uniref:Uncharacterized protein n=1 Tax=Calycina marina TaxID=1763456 RepID=A0A9P7Z9J8_9HELO|nr:hypothetical protein BJ878DRAFT_176905 [Calycina marina]